MVNFICSRMILKSENNILFFSVSIVTKTDVLQISHQQNVDPLPGAKKVLDLIQEVLYLRNFISRKLYI